MYTSGMSSIVVRNVPSDTKIKAQVRAVQAGVSLRQWVLDAIEWRMNDERAAGGGGEVDSRKDWAAGGGGIGDLQYADADAGTVQTTGPRQRRSGVRGLRGGIREDSGEGRESGDIGSGAILESCDSAQSESGAMAGGSPEDTERARDVKAARERMNRIGK